METDPPLGLPRPRRACSEPTYEGWKPVNSTTGTGPATSSEPTYEGWKLQEVVNEGPSQTMSSEPTYEGWKLASKRADKEAELRVPSLPMRDGNFDGSLFTDTRNTSSEPTYEGWKRVIVPLAVPQREEFRAYL